MTHHAIPDLHQVRAGFETWRRTRRGKARIPAPLREAVRKLLEHLPVSVVRKELHLSSQQLERLRRPLPAPAPAPAPTFLALTALDVAVLQDGRAVQTAVPAPGPAEDWLAVLERRDGTKLSVRVGPAGLERVITSFVRA